MNRTALSILFRRSVGIKGIPFQPETYEVSFRYFLPDPPLCMSLGLSLSQSLSFGSSFVFIVLNQKIPFFSLRIVPVFHRGTSEYQ